MQRPPVSRLPKSRPTSGRGISRIDSGSSKAAKRIAAGFLCSAAIALTATANASAPDRQLSSLEQFQADEARLFRIGHALATSNAPYCEETIQAPGFLLHDARSYANPGEVRSIFGLSGDIAIQAVADGSSAAMAGLDQNNTLETIQGIAVEERWAPSRPGWKRASDIRDTIETALVDGPLQVTWADQSQTRRSAEITGTPACRMRFELLDSSRKAKADGDRVLIGEDFSGLTYEDEAMFAAVVAHEMAHNIFRHPQLLKEVGRKRKLVRLSERDADRLMPWLLHNAGYDPAAAVRFMRKWGPKHGGWIFRDRSHDGWDERAEFIAAELPKIAAVLGADGKADWRRHFVKEFVLP